MNYYPHHIGDYITATAHLSMIEDGAYRRLLDLYYSREQALPLDRKALYRLARARARNERAAVDVVLDEFFEQTPLGWSHARCDAELELAQQKGEESGERKNHERDRQRRHRERRKTIFEALRAVGIVPAYDTPMTELETLMSRHLSRPSRDPSRDSETPVTGTATANQYPTANNQEEQAAAANPPPQERVRESVTPVEPVTPVAGDGGVTPVTAPPVTRDRPDAPPPPQSPVVEAGQDGSTAGPVRQEVRYATLIRGWEKARGKPPRITGSDPRLATWASHELNDEQLREAYDLAVADREANGDAGPINAGFLDIFVAKVLNPPSADSALNRSPAAGGQGKPWLSSWSGIVAKGAELGLTQLPDEMGPDFKARVVAAAGISDEERAKLRADFGVMA